MCSNRFIHFKFRGSVGVRDIKYQVYWDAKEWNGKEYITKWKMSEVHSLHLNKKKVIVSDKPYGNRSVEIGENCFLREYTGLNDKNGTPIYEGDIIRTVALLNDHHQMGATSILTVKYFMGNPSLCEKGYETGVAIYPFCVSHTLEVIGNVYEGVPNA